MDLLASTPELRASSDILAAQGVVYLRASRPYNCTGETHAGRTQDSLFCLKTPASHETSLQALDWQLCRGADLHVCGSTIQ